MNKVIGQNAVSRSGLTGMPEITAIKVFAIDNLLDGSICGSRFGDTCNYYL
jgi:hypothetical protein